MVFNDPALRASCLRYCPRVAPISCRASREAPTQDNPCGAKGLSATPVVCFEIDLSTRCEGLRATQREIRCSSGIARGDNMIPSHANYPQLLTESPRPFPGLLAGRAQLREDGVWVSARRAYCLRTQQMSREVSDKALLRVALTEPGMNPTEDLLTPKPIPPAQRKPVNANADPDLVRDFEAAADRDVWQSQLAGRCTQPSKQQRRTRCGDIRVTRRRGPDDCARRNWFEIQVVMGVRSLPDQTRITTTDQLVQIDR